MTASMYKLAFLILGANIFLWGMYSLNCLPKKGSWCRKWSILGVTATCSFWMFDNMAGNHYRIDGLFMLFAIAMHLWCAAWEEHIHSEGKTYAQRPPASPPVGVTRNGGDAAAQ